MKRLIVFKVLGIITICLFTFFNVSINFDNKDAKAESKLSLSTSIPVALGDDSDSFYCCLGWGSPCYEYCTNAPGQEKFPWV